MPKTFNDLIADALTQGVKEIFPWDVEDYQEKYPDALLLDIREQDEYDGAHIKDTLHVPRGILEQSCEWDYAETIPELVRARKTPILVICRSGNRSVLAALTMHMLGYEDVTSLKTGIKGWNDSDLPMVDKSGFAANPDWADGFFNPPVREDQLSANQ
ncbi:MAG TPA: rhodanese-like domain-containing protein [Leucothrix sp.]|nr:rhodanese-like domain-containing protein [Leucothrix sp.]HIQ15724.1 rhodanese-like domain-containing protein [Leucothrix sp.]